MTPAARLQAAIEILDQVLDAARSDGLPADVLHAQYFRTRRYAGSKDRAAVRDLLFAILRTPAVINAATARQAAMIWAQQFAPDQLACFGAGGHAPAAVMPDEIPGSAVLPVDAEQLAAYGPMLTRAPLDIRVDLRHLSRVAAQSALARNGIASAPTPFAPTGLRCPADAAIDRTALYLDGLIDVQDEGSQIVALLARAQPGMTVIDLCAGAGGKTLALADAMAARGRLIAHDIDERRLAQLNVRAARAGLDQWIETRCSRLNDLHGSADIVLVDAPCTGSGTWRRNPESRLRPQSARLARYVPLQQHLLRQAARLVRPGGTIVYAVCSIYGQEGEAHLAALPPGLQAVAWQSHWPVGALAPAPDAPETAGLKLTPKSHGCDGFFIVCLHKAW